MSLTSTYALSSRGTHNASGRATCQLLLKRVQKLKPLLMQQRLIDEAAFELLIQQKQQDIHDEAFCATGALFSVTASMPFSTGEHVDGGKS